MFIGEKLRNGLCDEFEIFDQNSAQIHEMYQEVLAATFNDKETGEDSHASICTILSICLLYDIDEIKFPLSFEEGDDDLICKIAAKLDLFFTLEKMTEKDFLTKTEVDGQTYFSCKEKKQK